MISMIMTEYFNKIEVQQQQIAALSLTSRLQNSIA